MFCIFYLSIVNINTQHKHYKEKQRHNNGKAQVRLATTDDSMGEM